ncbi:MAG: hypothetical protein O2865_06520 [Planctomycetota bacterium]|nr:hypothetical protein [Planctomycetota bacterium]MDA0934378.1 hypothetical protein [Planctomycetota bacterium]
MLKIIKWTVLGTVVLLAGGFLLFGTHLGSYVGTAVHEARRGVSETIPIEFELERARDLIEAIEPELHEARREVAQAEVDLQNVRNEVERLEVDVEVGARKLRNVSTSLCADESGINLTSFDRRRVEFDLERTFDTFRNQEALLSGKRALIERQERAVEAARQRLDAVRIEKARLEDLVATLTTQKRQLDALAASSRTIELDDSALGRARDVLNDIQNRLDVTQRMLEDEVYLGAEPTAVISGRDILSEIEAHFATASGGLEVVRGR